METIPLQRLAEILSQLGDELKGEPHLQGGTRRPQGQVTDGLMSCARQSSCQSSKTSL